ncbi:hypothetical protein BH11ARM1_BH11ARM1_13040 [soil metagenome]
MSLRYFETINGSTLAQVVDADRVEFLVDAVGSVTSTVADGLTIRDTYEYSAYGEILYDSGVDVSARLLWVCSLGYLANPKRDGKYYVRSRVFDSISLDWMSKDGLWPTEAPYTYADSDPVNFADPTGFQKKPPSKKGANFKVDENWARVRSTREVENLVTGSVALPSQCDLDSDTPSVWYSFYLSFADGSGVGDPSNLDCGVSIACSDKVSPDTGALLRPKGWQKWVVPPNDIGLYKPCPECGPLKTIDVKIFREKFLRAGVSIGQCTVGMGASFPARLGKLSPSYGQMAMGSGYDSSKGDRTAHSLSGWSDTRIDGLTWLPPFATAPQTHGGYITNGVNVPFNLAAHLRNPLGQCKCFAKSIVPDWTGGSPDDNFSV